MYFYVYDNFLVGKRYERLLGRLETQANNLGLTGERGQVTSLRKVEDIVRDAAQRKYAPIVVVGDDRTFNAATNALAKNPAAPALAYIPVKAEQPIAELLGLTPENSIVTLSRRIERPIRLAFANEYCFVGRLTCVQATDPRKSRWLGPILPEKNRLTANISVDGVHIEACVHELVVQHDSAEGKLRLSLVRHSKKRLAVRPTVEQSVFWGRQFQIKSKLPLACYLDGRQIVRTPVLVTSSDKTVRVIVGRQRLLL